mgnify:FL=1|tara:strand:- start:433 stop:624 length:192 start_codon:yes stop_codon:yes gene_type:complete
MNTTTKEELIKLILKLSYSDYIAFKNNYSITGSRELLEFIEELDKETQEEVINEIHLNTETEY